MEDAGGGERVRNLQGAGGRGGEVGAEREGLGPGIDTEDGRAGGNARTDDDLASEEARHIADDEGGGVDVAARDGLIELDVESSGGAGKDGDVPRRRAGPAGGG